MLIQLSTDSHRTACALMAAPIGCCLRRAEADVLKLEVVQIQEGHWGIADLHRKRGCVCTC